MAHEIETMMYVKETPWHGLGTYVGDENVTSDVALSQSGLDWEVNKVPLKTVFENSVSTHVAIERSTDSKILGIVGSKYSPMQNREAFSFLDSLVEDGSMRYHTAGSLRGGQRVWLLGQIGSHEVVPDDRVDQFVMLYNSHDGSSALRVLWTQVRVVCANTAAMALGASKEKDGMAIRHTLNMDKKVSQAHKVLGLARASAAKTAEFQKHLAKRSMSESTWLDFVASLVPDSVVEDARNTRRENIREELTNLFNNGIGTDIAGVRGTQWAAYNAVTEFTNHHSTVKSHKDGLRFENVLFGAGASLHDRAVQLLMHDFA